MGFVVLLLAVFFTTPVAAQEEAGKIGGWPSEFEGRQPVGMPPGEGWKVVSGDGTLLTSDCVGVFTSPECVLDTVLACEAWSWMDEVTAVDSSGYKYFWNPICDTLRSRPGDAGTGVRSFRGGRDNPEDFSYYYKAVPFVLTEGNVPSRHAPPYPEGWSCDWCPGDVAVAYLIISCAPDPAVIGRTMDSVRYDDDFPDDSLISDCGEPKGRNALVVRQDDLTGLWRIVEPYRPGMSDGSGLSEGWPYLRRLYQGIR